MAALNAINPTLLDLQKRMDPDGKIAPVVEILNETSEVLADLTVLEGNLPTGHRTTLRTGIPTPTWRRFNEGVQPTKSTTRQVTNNCGMLESYTKIDAAMARLNNNEAAWRMSEELPQIEGMNQEMSDTLFYGNEGTEPEAFTGLSPYYNSLSAESADNIIVGGSADTDNASIWLIVWGPNTIHGIVPKGVPAGIQFEDMGEQLIQSQEGVSGNLMKALVTHYVWNMGLCVKDWRYAVRIPNIEKSALSKTYTAGAFSTGADLTDLMFQAMRRIPNLSMGRAAFYMSRDIATWVARQTSAKGQNGLITVDPMGDATVSGSMRYTERFHGIPMRRVDALAADESLVS